ncbi:MAG: WYL domain-containing protein [Bacteroidetes bacterium]|nr:WYL domain-containing protein [Bacteroidota bacterium]
MSKSQYIKRYLLIIHYLKRGLASWPEIESFLDRQSEIESDTYQISQRTFQRDINEIRSIFSIDIQYNKTQNCYFISDEEDINNHTQLLDSFHLFNALSLHHNYTQYIHFENRIPKGTEHIHHLLLAIKNKWTVHLTYHKHYEEYAEEVVLYPYLIKQFKGRWYVLGIKESTQQLRTYALDRVVQMDIKKKKFIADKNFNPAYIFQHCFGIITPENEKPKKIIFEFNEQQAKYIKGYPLHTSQKIVQEKKGGNVVFEITVYQTYDLMMELLSYGDELNIHSPEELRQNLIQLHQEALKKLKKIHVQ